MTTLLSTYGLPYLAGKWISPSLMRDWLSIPNVNTFIMIMTGIWQGIGIKYAVVYIWFKKHGLYTGGGIYD